jgi:hypothetical protein
VPLKALLMPEADLSHSLTVVLVYLIPPTLPSMAPSTKSHGQPSRLDTLSFAKYMKNVGRAYRKQAMELISICRLFVQAQKQSFRCHSEKVMTFDVIHSLLILMIILIVR